MSQCSIRAGKEGKNPPARLGKPDELSQKSAGFAPGEGASGQGEPLHDHASIVGRQGMDGAKGRADVLSNECGGWQGLKDRLGTDEEAGRAEVHEGPVNREAEGVRG